MNLLNLHALWRLCRAVLRRKSDSSIEVIFKELHPRANPKQASDTIHLGILMGFFENPRRGELSAHGVSFAKSEHWKTWSPNFEQQKSLNHLGIDHKHCKNTKSRKTILDLFCGAGGLGLGFEMAGFSVVAAVDNDKQAIEAHKKNFPNCEVFFGDIHEISKNPKEKLLSVIKDKKINGIVGGPPCQGFSFIGERVVSDERNLLTSRFMDIVMVIQPDFFVMENVGGLLNIGARPGFYTHLSQYAKSIGPAANLISSALPNQPNAPNRRERQYNKRLVSLAITNFQKNCKKNASNTDKKDLIYTNRKCLINILEKEIEKKFNGLSYYSAIKVLKRSQKALFLISIATSFLKGKAKKSDNTEKEALEGLKALARKNDGCGRASREILSAYYRMEPTSLLRGKPVGPILKNLIKRASKDYVISSPTLLSSAWYGAPQDRRRLFLIGIHKRIDREFVFPNKTHFIKSEKDKNPNCLPAVTCHQTIGDLPNIDNYPELIENDVIASSERGDGNSNFSSLMAGETYIDDQSFPRESWDPFSIDCCKRTIHSKHVLARLKGVGFGVLDSTSGKTRLKPNDVAHTLRAGTREAMGSHTAVRPIHYKYDRVISVREGARLMGFPDWMTFHPTKWHGFRLVGNGVPAQLGRAIADAIQRQIYKNSEKPNTMINGDSLRYKPSKMALSLNLE